MKVSVIVTSYNHEKYINQCMDSVLSQKGNFQMEIIVGDDSSTDNTLSIFEQYSEKHPNIIILDKQPNMGVTKNLKRCLDACTGEYIAICEGDDYWIDDHKLEKQISFLEEFEFTTSMCFNSILLKYENKDRSMQHPDQSKLKNQFYTAEQLIEKNFIGNFSCCMYRGSVIKNLPEKLFEMYSVDWIVNICCDQFGRIGYIPEIMSVYRIHEKGAWSGISEIDKLKELLGHIDNYNAFLDYKYSSQFLLQKDLINIEIERLNNLSLYTASVDNNSVNKDLYWLLLKVKSKAKTIIRKINN